MEVFMVQIILTFIIVGFVIGVAIFRLIRYFKNPLEECEGCSQHCSVCSLEELKKEIDEKKDQKSKGLTK
jgi:hypothetical protein